MHVGMHLIRPALWVTGGGVSETCRGRAQLSSPHPTTGPIPWFLGSTIQASGRCIIMHACHACSPLLLRLFGRP